MEQKEGQLKKLSISLIVSIVDKNVHEKKNKAGYLLYYTLYSSFLE